MSKKQRAIKKKANIIEKVLLISVSSSLISLFGYVAILSINI